MQRNFPMNWYWYRIEGHWTPPPGSVKASRGKPSDAGLDVVADRSARLAGGAQECNGVAVDEAGRRWADRGSAAPPRAGS
jgi:hypothetical protein